MQRRPSPDGYVTVANQIVSPLIAKSDYVTSADQTVSPSKDHEMR